MDRHNKWERKERKCKGTYVNECTEKKGLFFRTWLYYTNNDRHGRGCKWFCVFLVLILSLKAVQVLDLSSVLFV